MREWRNNPASPNDADHHYLFDADTCDQVGFVCPEGAGYAVYRHRPGHRSLIPVGHRPTLEEAKRMLEQDAPA